MNPSLLEQVEANPALSRRYALMKHALAKGKERLRLGTTDDWWPELAPLLPAERMAVKRDLQRDVGLKHE